jgi:hypothetical protein
MEANSGFPMYGNQQLIKRGNVTGKYILPFVLALVALFAFWIIAVQAGFFLSKDDRKLERHIAALPYNKTIPLSQLPPLDRYETICIVDAYAVRSGARQQESLTRIFGSIDYSEFRDEIVNIYSDHDTTQGIYPVQDNKLLPAIHVFPGYHTYLRPGRHPHGKEWRYFPLSSCYSPKDVCLRRGKDDKYSWHKIIIDFCNDFTEE